MEKELRSIEAELRNCPDEWQWHVACVIAEIPRGYIATYGTLAEIANRRYGHRINARNVAYLRRELYKRLTHDTQIPLHRVAKIGDVESHADSDTTKSYNDKLRGLEGSLYNPMWWEPVA